MRKLMFEQRFEIGGYSISSLEILKNFQTTSGSEIRTFVGLIAKSRYSCLIPTC